MTHDAGLMTTEHEARRLWPELAWIADEGLRERVARTWETALARSSLTPSDLERVPFSLLAGEGAPAFLAHKRCVVHIARGAARAMKQHLGDALPIDEDVVVAGAILADVGKLLEYELDQGELRESARGALLRHPFLGVALALECGVPPEVCHVIAAHAGEGDLAARSVEATIVHHADFMAYSPFRDRARRAAGGR